jgi:hypothetical protein
MCIVRLTVRRTTESVHPAALKRWVGLHNRERVSIGCDESTKVLYDQGSRLRFGLQLLESGIHSDDDLYDFDYVYVSRYRALMRYTVDIQLRDQHISKTSACVPLFPASLPE